jgi:hypothetical protein
VLLICKATSLIRRGGVTRGRLRARNVTNNTVTRRVPRGKESIPIAATALLFAGDVETGISIGRSYGRLLQPSEHPRQAGDQRGARRVHEEGSLIPLLRRQPPTKGRWALHSERVGPEPHFAIASTILGATDGGFDAAPRTCRSEEQWSSAF